jgi:hypothetical protein
MFFIIFNYIKKCIDNANYTNYNLLKNNKKNNDDNSLNYELINLSDFDDNINFNTNNKITTFAYNNYFDDYNNYYTNYETNKYNLIMDLV